MKISPIWPVGAIFSLAALFWAAVAIAQVPGGVSGGATSANQTNGNQKTQIVDGSGNVIGSTSNALNVDVVAGGGGGAVYGPTAVGTAAANPPVLAGGTADGTATGNVGVLKVVSGVGSVNTAQVNGVTTLTGAGAVGTGSARVAVGQDTTTIAGAAPGTAGTASANVLTVQGVASMTPLLVTPSAPADPCFASSKLYADFESTSSGGSIITAVSAKKAYLCSITIGTSTAANVSLIEGTGSSVCTGGTPAGIFLNTGVTAANGFAFPANGGVQAGAGNGTIAANGTANYNVCVAFTTTNSPQVNVHVSYVQQ